MADQPCIADLTISIIALDRPAFFQAAVDSLVSTTPPGATLQLTLNESGPTTRQIAEWACGVWDGPTSLFETPSRLNFVDAHNFALANVGTAFVNFMGDDEGQDRVRASYRDNYERLVEVKNKYDPTNLFHVNQNIKPTV